MANFKRKITVFLHGLISAFFGSLLSAFFFFKKRYTKMKVFAKKDKLQQNSFEGESPDVIVASNVWVNSGKMIL